MTIKMGKYDYKGKVWGIELMCLEGHYTLEIAFGTHSITVGF